MGKKKRPGPRKFWPRRLTAGQIQEGNRLYQAAKARSAAAAVRIADYKKFCRANYLDPKDLEENLYYFVAQQRDDDLGPRTIKRYTLLIAGRLNARNGEPTLADLLDVLNTEMLGAPRRHAEDFDDGTLIRILTCVFEENPCAGVCATMMIWTGLRYKDLVYLSWECVELKKEYLRIDVSRTRAAHRQGSGLWAGDRFHERRSSGLLGRNRCHLYGWPRGDPTVLKTAQIGLLRQFESLVSRHLPDGEFGWGGISVTRQRRCPKASSVGTEISRRTQA